MPLLPREILEWTEKDPADLLDYALDFAPQFGPDDGVSTVSWSVAADLTTHQQAITGHFAIIWLSGGASGARYLVACEATSVAGRHARLAASLPVRKYKAL